ncbi:MAG TPA: PrsW family glutamic-type intramembrane protease, partial [Candidatus Elarobacter sp.]|nr:PrsW family glutamic-type intramembrane protease [Candidatus Elarobacter sp.]
SLLWALFFGAAFHSTGIRWRKALFAYFGTSLIGMTLLTLALVLNVEAIRDPLIAATNPLISIPASIVFIGFPEELTKALVLFAMWRFFGVPGLRTFLFYGLVSGLGFGISEGIGYQVGPYAAAAQHTGDIGAYYLANVLRLTSLPFFHAVWAGTAAYLIWFGARIPSARAGFIVLAILIPATFHGLYDALSDRWELLALLTVGLSIVLLGIYVASAAQFERWLGLPPDADPDAVATAAVPVAAS